MTLEPHAVNMEIDRQQRSPDRQSTEEMFEEASEDVEPLADLEESYHPPTTMASNSSQSQRSETPTRHATRKRGAGDSLGLAFETSLKQYLDRKGALTPKK